MHLAGCARPCVSIAPTTWSPSRRTAASRPSSRLWSTALWWCCSTAVSAAVAWTSTSRLPSVGVLRAVPLASAAAFRAAFCSLSALLFSCSALSNMSKLASACCLSTGDEPAPARRARPRTSLQRTASSGCRMQRWPSPFIAYCTALALVVCLAKGSKMEKTSSLTLPPVSTCAPSHVSALVSWPRASKSKWRQSRPEHSSARIVCAAMAAAGAAAASCFRSRWHRRASVSPTSWVFFETWQTAQSARMTPPIDSSGTRKMRAVRYFSHFSSSLRGGWSSSGSSRGSISHTWRTAGAASWCWYCR
mmetsp:Transcript_14476/g.35901  ORF Transcript_14476/g.35901 Transcript_14476/m.35901 type:complete len:305 (+) Transcript_14476:225-1139(+)